MQHRKLGRTGLDVSVVDLLFPFREYRDNLSAALCGYRERVVLTGHLGATEKDGQYCKTRSAKKE